MEKFYNAMRSLTEWIIAILFVAFMISSVGTGAIILFTKILEVL